jgi:hypothetical protein
MAKCKDAPSMIAQAVAEQVAHMLDLHWNRKETTLVSAGLPVAEGVDAQQLEVTTTLHAQTVVLQAHAEAESATGAAAEVKAAVQALWGILQPGSTVLHHSGHVPLKSELRRSSCVAASAQQKTAAAPRKHIARLQTKPWHSRRWIRSQQMLIRIRREQEMGLQKFHALALPPPTSHLVWHRGARAHRRQLAV